MKKVKVDLDKIPDEYKHLCKEEMTQAEIAMLGTIIFKMKAKSLKERLFRRYYERKNERKNKETP